MTPRIDPIAFEVFKNALFSIADEMALTILRTAYSGVLKDVMDYSTAFCDGEGRTVAQGLTLHHTHAHAPQGPPRWPAKIAGAFQKPQRMGEGKIGLQQQRQQAQHLGLRVAPVEIPDHWKVPGHPGFQNDQSPQQQQPRQTKADHPAVMHHPATGLDESLCECRQAQFEVGEDLFQFGDNKDHLKGDRAQHE